MLVAVTTTVEVGVAVLPSGCVGVRLGVPGTTTVFVAVGGTVAVAVLVAVEVGVSVGVAVGVWRTAAAAAPHPALRRNDALVDRPPASGSGARQLATTKLAEVERSRPPLSV